jgi:FK506-binding protein 4/5
MTMSASTPIKGGMSPLETVIVASSEDGSPMVIKEIIKRGSGDASPLEGDTVTVDYTGSLDDGTVFDSSKNAGRDPFSFVLGKGQVIRGWDTGVSTMTKGEVSRLIISSEYGYGSSGSPPTIPPNARLTFEVELHSWKEAADISELGDGSLKKYVMQAGTGYATPKLGDEVIVEKYDAEDEGKCLGTFSFTVGAKGGSEESPIHSAVQKMKVEEKARVVWSFSDNTKGESVVYLKKLYRVEWLVVDKLRMKRMNEVDGWQHPNPGAKVSMRVVYGDDNNKTEEIINFEVDEEQAPCEAIELAAMKMKCGETVMICTYDQTYLRGHEGLIKLYSEKDMAEVSLTLEKMEKAKESWEMDEAEKVAAATAAKAKGNAAFKKGRIERALTLWERSKGYIEMRENWKDSDLKSEAKALHKAIDLNLSAGYLKAHDPRKARGLLNEILESDPYNLKALFRRIESWIATQDLIEARMDIKQALGIDPDSKDLLALEKKLAHAEARNAVAERKMWGKMFA